MHVTLFNPGLIDYAVSRQYQKEAVEHVHSGALDAALIVCRHAPVITIGRGGRRENITAGDAELASVGISVHTVERGGDVTYHGPGQITLYPVFNLAHMRKDIHWFLRALENAGILFLRGTGVEAGRRQGYTGVWAGSRKIASIGIAVRHWVTYHGMSLNITAADCLNFRRIRPCGMNVEMTSVEAETGKIGNMTALEQEAAAAVCGVFGIDMRRRSDFPFGGGGRGGG